MAVQSNQFTCTTTAKLMCSLPTAVKGMQPQVTINLITGSGNAFVGGPGLANSGGNGFKLAAPAAAPWPQVTIVGSGDVWAVGAAGSEVLTYVISWVDG